MRPRILLFVALLAMLLPAVVRAQLLGGGTPRPGAEPVTARAEISQEPLLPGSEAQIIVELSIIRGYHAQSAFAAKPNIPAKIILKPFPAGIVPGPIEAQTGLDIPTPPALGTGTLSVYEGKSYFRIPLKIAADAPPGDATLEFNLVTQACNDTSCDPPRTTALKVPVTIGKSGDSQKTSPLVALTHEKTFLPQPVPEPPATVVAPATPSELRPAAAGKEVPLHSTAQQLELIRQRPYQPYNSEEGRYPVPVYFLFALLGGLILNVMPCVLPVIPLKALSFVQQAHGSPRLAFLHSLAFSAGIVSLFVALAVVLRTFGLFYGQQFQSPAFLIAMVMFVVALALSMLGVWTVQPPRAVYAADEKLSHQSGLAGSFSSGLMATLLATPCSAPFLGPVLAWALVQPPVMTALLLAVVGLGMSLPYLILAAFPQALNKIPRAGRWSELLKQLLGIVMLGVAFYLLTLVPNIHLWPWVLAGTVVTALVCWGWGQIPSVLMSPARIWTIRAVTVAIGVLLGAGLWWVAILTQPATSTVPLAGTAFLPDKLPAGNAWLPFNVALLDQALKDGRPVVVDWTADWCINCRVLEAAVLDREETKSAFVARNVLLLRGDLSEDNPPADTLNQKLGSRAIPVLAIFAPSRPVQPVVLRDSYSISRVAREVQNAK